MSHQAVTLACSLITPWLVLTLALQRAARPAGVVMRGTAAVVVPGAVAAGLLLLPLGGLPVWAWIRGVSANFSIPLAGILAAICWERAGGRRLLSGDGRNDCWVFGAGAGAVLYPMALGLGGLDPYEWGWGFSPLFVVVGVLTGWLIWKRRALGWLLLLAAAACRLRILESANYWDYLVDPIYFVTSLVVLGGRLAVRLSSSTWVTRPRREPLDQGLSDV